MKQILTIGRDAKTVKGLKYGYLTGILYLAPYNISGYQVCPMAEKAKCIDACLYTAGRGVMSNVQAGRIKKTKLFHENKQEFMMHLVNSIAFVVRKAKRENLIPLIRLNGTSDIIWENVKFEYDNKSVSIFDVFPDVQFYDYGKIPTRKNIPANYDLTFSYSGVESFKPAIKKALNNPNYKRMAVVFDKQENFPDKFLGRDVIDGDNSDIRHLDRDYSVIALYAKGQARKDTTGFVVRGCAKN